MHPLGETSRTNTVGKSMKNDFTNCFCAALCLFLGTFPSFVLASNHGVILAYHHVASDTPPSTSISPEDFQKHLEFLKDNNFNVLPLPEMVEALRKQLELPDKAVAISFDDGYSSIYDTAFPLLQKYNFPFTLFLSTGPINEQQGGYMNWGEIREMSEYGATIANHTVSHPYMLEKRANEADDNEAWLARLRQEIVAAEREIEQHTQQNHRYLAYPYGEFNPELKALLQSMGYTGFAQNSGAIGLHSDFLALPRFPLASIYARLETAAVKMGSKAFNVSLLEPHSPVTRETRPTAILQFAAAEHQLDRISCFTNGNPLAIEWMDRAQGIMKLQPERAVNGRRWRYICTAPTQEKDRFFWYSVQWIRPD